MHAFSSTFRALLSKELKGCRQSRNLTQDAMSQLLYITPRSYVDLEQEKYLCSTCVFILYIVMLTDREVLALVGALRAATAREP